MAIDYKKYPLNWKNIRMTIMKRAGHRCEFCGVLNHTTIYRHKTNPTLYVNMMPVNTSDRGEWRKKATRVTLTIAHLFNDDPMDADESNLMALCQLHHLGLDAMRRKWKRNTLRG